jgi:hypothetical protein
MEAHRAHHLNCPGSGPLLAPLGRFGVIRISILPYFDALEPKVLKLP